MINGEDKQIGPYFASKKVIQDKKLFANKILVYLWKDVFKIDRSLLFNTSSITGIDSLISTFQISPLNVFNEDFLSLLNLNTTDKIEY